MHFSCCQSTSIQGGVTVPDAVKRKADADVRKILDLKDAGLSKAVSLTSLDR